MNNIKKVLILLLIILSISLYGCDKKEKEINIAIQYGLTYAPLEIMKKNSILEKKIKGYKINYVILSNTAAIREGMLSGSVDIGFMAIPPFLVGKDNGMNWKIITGLSSSECVLFTNNEKIKSIKDFSKNDKIALPQPGSVQHILLSMGLKNIGEDPHSLDKNILTISHPDGMALLLSGKEVSAHFTTPPYSINEREKEGISSILDGKETFGGDFTFIVGVAWEKFLKENKNIGLFNEALEEAIEYVNEDKEGSLEYLHTKYHMKKEDLEEYIDKNKVKYSTKVEGVEKFASFMEETNFIKNKIDINSIYFER